jgi:hypothetical protein
VHPSSVEDHLRAKIAEALRTLDAKMLRMLDAQIEASEG